MGQLRGCLTPPSHSSLGQAALLFLHASRLKRSCPTHLLTPQGPLSFFTARQLPSFTKSHLDLTFTCASTETQGRRCLSLYSQSLTLQAGPEASSCSLLSHLDRHSTASFVNLRLKIPSEQTGLPLIKEKVQVTSALWGQPPAT